MDVGKDSILNAVEARHLYKYYKAREHKEIAL
jgi:hypothetical protein